MTPVLGETLTFTLSIVWLLVLVLAGVRLLGLLLGGTRLVADRRTALALCAAAVMLAIGITWGLPGPSWALDEVDAASVRKAVAERFANGWFDKYPPLHFGLLAVSAAPVLAAERWNVLADGVNADYILMVQFRLVSLVMAVGCLALVGVLSDRLSNPAPRWLAVLCAAGVLPFVYYGKTANLEVPYAFWLLASFVLLLDAHRHGRLRDFVGFGIASALAVTTKDQAYGFYLLPGLYLVWVTRNMRFVVLGAFAALLTFLLVYNVPLNSAGLSSHVSELLGPASANYRMFPFSPAGQLPLAAATAACLLFGAGVAGSALIVAGLSGRDAPVSTPIVLGVASYYLTFIVPAGYVYDRFLMPVLLLAAPVAACGAWRLATRWSGAAAGRLLATVLVLATLWRAGSVDLVMLRDARYAAEAWLETHVPAGATVGFAGLTVYLPRLEPYDEIVVTPTVDATLVVRPDFIVVNTEWMQRFAPGSPRRLWLQWLESGAGPYRQVFRHKDPLGGTWLRWDRRFTDRIEDPFTNLDKVNPETAIFALTR